MRKRTSSACTDANRSLKPPHWRLPFLLPFTPCRRSVRYLRHAQRIIYVLSVIASICLSLGTPGVRSIAQGARQPDSSTQLTELLKGVPDVTIFVIPTSGDTARVSLAFSSRVSHAKVRQEIEKLRANGWGIANDITLSDGSISASGRVTTSGHFSLIKSPQVVNNAPEVLPYLQAFQDRSHVTVVFLLSELKPYNGIDSYETPALVVRRMPADNAYQYEALILDHQGKLPSHAAASPSITAPASPMGGTQGAAPAGMPLLPLMLVLCAIGIIGGLFVYNWIARRADRRVPTRRAR